jgi:hypothetical protein
MPAFAAGAANAKPRTTTPLASAQAKLLFLCEQNATKARMTMILQAELSPGNTSATKIFEGP